MNTFYINQPVAKGKPVFGIADFIPVGRVNAITREELLQICISEGLCQSDRDMRRLIEKARIDYVILNHSDGNGYYRPSREDAQELQRYIRQEEKRAKSTFKNITMAKALYEDYKRGRIGGTEDEE